MVRTRSCVGEKGNIGERGEGSRSVREVENVEIEQGEKEALISKVEELQREIEKLRGEMKAKKVIVEEERESMNDKNEGFSREKSNQKSGREKSGRKEGEGTLERKTEKGRREKHNDHLSISKQEKDGDRKRSPGHKHINLDYNSSRSNESEQSSQNFNSIQEERREFEEWKAEKRAFETWRKERRSNNGMRQATSKISNPFSKTIMATMIPKGFKFPQFLELYDGTTDPQDHVNRFETTLYVTEASESLKCRAFPSTLKGDALSWFASLEAGSIIGYDSLISKFLNQFSANRIYKKTPSCLMTLRQEDDESLREFMDRFNREARQVRKVSNDVAMHAIIAGLRPRSFANDLARRAPETIEELRDRANEFVDVEETEKARKVIRGMTGNMALMPTIPRGVVNKVQWNPGTKLGVRTGFLPPRRDLQYKKSRFDTFDGYTPVNTGREQLLLEIYHTGLIKLPVPEAVNPNANRSKRCEYHRGK